MTVNAGATLYFDAIFCMFIQSSKAGSIHFTKKSFSASPLFSREKDFLSAGFLNVLVLFIAVFFIASYCRQNFRICQLRLPYNYTIVFKISTSFITSSKRLLTFFVPSIVPSVSPLVFSVLARSSSLNALKFSTY